MMLAAAGLAMSSVATNAASSLSIARAAPAMSGVSYFQDDEEDNRGGGSTAVILGVILVVLIGAAAISGNSGSGPGSP
jgi:hypothetical protein